MSASSAFFRTWSWFKETQPCESLCTSTSWPLCSYSTVYSPKFLRVSIFSTLVKLALSIWVSVVLISSLFELDCTQTTLKSEDHLPQKSLVSGRYLNLACSTISGCLITPMLPAWSPPILSSGRLIVLFLPIEADKMYAPRGLGRRNSLHDFVAFSFLWRNNSSGIRWKELVQTIASR